MNVSMQHKSIGIVDYSLDNFHADVYLRALRGPLAERGYAIAGATAQLIEPSQTWCRQNDIRFFETAEELNPHVQFFMVLAPSHPHLHWEMCRQVFPFGKTTFVDKTFAPDVETARKIFQMADQYGVAVQTTSALRTTNVQQSVRELTKPLRHITVTAGGSSWEEYGIHPVELIVSCLGPNVEKLMRIGPTEHPLFLLVFSEQRTATIDFHATAHVPFHATLANAEQVLNVTVDDGCLFVDAAAAILDFFDAGRANINREETLAIRRILDRASDADANEQFVLLPHQPFN